MKYAVLRQQVFMLFKNGYRKNAMTRRVVPVEGIHVNT